MGPGIGAVLIEELVRARSLAALVDPPPLLPGWEGLCALEYTAAVLRIRDQVAAACHALDTAIVLLGAL